MDDAASETSARGSAEGACAPSASVPIIVGGTLRRALPFVRCCWRLSIEPSGASARSAATDHLTVDALKRVIKAVLEIIRARDVDRKCRISICEVRG